MGRVARAGKMTRWFARFGRMARWLRVMKAFRSCRFIAKVKKQQQKDPEEEEEEEEKLAGIIKAATDDCLLLSFTVAFEPIEKSSAIDGVGSRSPRTRASGPRF